MAISSSTKFAGLLGIVLFCAAVILLDPGGLLEKRRKARLLESVSWAKGTNQQPGNESVCYGWVQTGTCERFRSHLIADHSQDADCDTIIDFSRSGSCNCSTGSINTWCYHVNMSCSRTCAAGFITNDILSPPTHIPKIIHLTVRDKDENSWSKVQRDCIHSWRDKNPTFDVRLYSDAEILEFISDEQPEKLSTFQKLEGIEKIDFFRYLVLNTYGGLYADADAECVKPINFWGVSDVNFVVGIEFNSTDDNYREHGFARKCQFCQWTMATIPGHPIVNTVIDSIVSSVSSTSNLDENDLEVLDLTGPGAWTDAINNYLSSISEPLTVGRHKDVLVLPYEAFGFHPLHFTDANRPPAPDRYVKHYFLGSWRRPTKPSATSTPSPPQAVITANVSGTTQVVSEEELLPHLHHIIESLLRKQ